MSQEGILVRDEIRMKILSSSRVILKQHLSLLGQYCESRSTLKTGASKVTGYLSTLHGVLSSFTQRISIPLSK